MLEAYGVSCDDTEISHLQYLSRTTRPFALIRVMENTMTREQKKKTQLYEKTEKKMEAKLK